ncbi:MAG TPA: dihydrodipicolinate synthase family protein [Armatimonadota bacterium]|jgi:4-hydroxy-tetrahydrodipicolinate synthase
MEGFYTALGTPIDEQGNFISTSFKKQVEDQIDAGALGLLALGSMGMQPCIKNADCRKVAEAAVEAAKGRCQIVVGVMDNSVSRVMDRIDQLSGVKIDGVVATTPFYETATPQELISFFKGIAARSPFPVYLYDLPSATKLKITPSIVSQLMSVQNIKGIKTADMVLGRKIMTNPATRSDFQILCSNLDAIDFAYKGGLKIGLDGMFTMTPSLIADAYTCMKSGDFTKAAKLINDILSLRDVLVDVEVFPGFTHAMNLLGYEGLFQPDYAPLLTDSQKEKVRNAMQSSGVL